MYLPNLFDIADFGYNIYLSMHTIYNFCILCHHKMNNKFKIKIIRYT